ESWPGRVWQGSLDAGGEKVAGAAVAGDLSNGSRSGSACGRGMAVAAVARRGVAASDQRGMGEGTEATGEKPRRHAGGVGEEGAPGGVCPRRDAAVVRHGAGSDDGGDSRPSGVRDGLATYRGGQTSQRVAAQEANRPDICYFRHVGDEGA